MKIVIKLPNGNVLEQLFTTETVYIGRAKTNDMVVANEALSRQHCQVIEKDGAFHIIDMDSANGVFIEGEKIPPHVKTPYSTFMQLHLGSLECFITHSDTRPTGTIHEEKTQMFSRASIKKPALAPASTVKKPKKSINFKSILPVLMIAIGAGVYFSVYQKSDEVKVLGPEAKAIINTPEKMRHIPDEFLSTAIYEEKYLQRKCEGNVCQDMGLHENHNEGVLMEEHQAFVFVKPQTHYQDEAYKAAVERPDKNELIALSLLIKSQLFQKFQNKELAQIHLVLRDDTKSVKVYRFHVKTFEARNFERIRFLISLRSALGSASNSTFWGRAKPYIRNLEL